MHSKHIYIRIAQSLNAIHRGSYMSIHVLSNLLDELGKKIIYEVLPSILSVFPNVFNIFSYHMTSLLFSG